MSTETARTTRQQLIRRRGNGQHVDRVNTKWAAHRRRKAWAYWRPWGVSPCYALQNGGECPYFPSPQLCPTYKRWNKAAMPIPPCRRERATLTDVRDSLALAGLPSATSMALSAGLLAAQKKDDLALYGQVIRSIGQLQLELLRLGHKNGKPSEPQLVEDLLAKLAVPGPESSQDARSDAAATPEPSSDSDARGRE